MLRMTIIHAIQTAKTIRLASIFQADQDNWLTAVQGIWAGMPNLIQWSYHDPDKLQLCIERLSKIKEL